MGAVATSSRICVAKPRSPHQNNEYAGDDALGRKAMSVVWRCFHVDRMSSLLTDRAGFLADKMQLKALSHQGRISKCHLPLI
jgi:hypothetical protein